MISIKGVFFLVSVMFLGCVTQVSAAGRIRVISYNILEGMKTDTTPGKQVFAAWVKQQDPDILALQECNKFTEAALRQLARSYGHPYAVIVKEKGYPTGLTSKYPILNVQKITTNMTHGFIVARIKDLNVVVLHLGPHNYLRRRAEIGKILDTIAKAPSRTNWIMMGDFNSVSPLDKDNYADGQLLALLQQDAQRNPTHTNLIDGLSLDYAVQQRILDFGLQDTGKLMDKGREITGKRIDFVYVSKDLLPRVTTAHFIKDSFTAKYSDHKPVIMEFND